MALGRTIFTGIAVAAAIGIGARLMRLKQLGDTITYRFRKLSRNKTAGSLTVEMDLINPTQTELAINSVFGNIVYGGRVVAIYNSKKPFVIKPGTTPLSLAFQVSSSSLLELIVRSAIARTAKDVTVNYRLNTLFGSIPQSFTIKASELI
jgi:hypothetical protein